MNWMLSIKRLLGRFWGEIFSDNDFILGVEYLHYLYSKLTGNQYLNWRNGMIAADLTVEQDAMPYLIYIDASEIRRQWYMWEALWTTGSAKKFLDNEFFTQAAEDASGWIAYSKYPVQEPFYMTDHLYGYTKVLIAGLDYEFYDGKFVFHVDPNTLGLDSVKMTDKDGIPHIYYKLFGHMKRDTKICDPVTGFESSWLNGCSDIAWDMHTNGATFYNVKQLLGKAVDAVICENDGTVGSIWKEQGYNCLQVGDRVYCSKKDPADGIVVGAAVTKGSVLFGKLAVFTGVDTPTATQVPGIKVMTDVGEMVAYNELEDADVYEGMNILPLKKDGESYLPYMKICADNMKNQMCPYIAIPESVNPFLFITQTIRRGRSVIVRLTADVLEMLSAAIQCIRRNSCAAGMINVYVEASTDSGDTLDTSKFSADAGMLAVAVAETFTIQNECAEAKVVL